MKKVLYLMMAISAIAFVSCKDDNDKKDKDNKPAAEEARVLEDFENGGMLSWTGADGCKCEVVANPAKAGINKSEKVGKYTTSTNAWDFVWTSGFGVTETHPDFEFLSFVNDGYVIKADIYAPAAGMPIYCKLEGIKGFAAKEKTGVVTTKANEWETLEFDFETLEMAENGYKNFVFCIDAGGTTDGTVVYIDNVRQVKGE